MKLKLYSLKSSLVCVLAGLMLAGCATSGHRQTEAERLEDRAINARVESALLGDDIVPGEAISVSTFEGTVQLGGSVNHVGERIRAEELTRNVAGVADVVNNIVVGRPTVDYGAPGPRLQRMPRMDRPPGQELDPTAAARPGAAPVF